MLKERISLKRAYVGTGLKYLLAAKQGFTKALQKLLPKLEGDMKATVTKNIISRQSRLVSSLIFKASCEDAFCLSLLCCVSVFSHAYIMDL